MIAELNDLKITKSNNTFIFLKMLYRTLHGFRVTKSYELIIAYCNNFTNIIIFSKDVKIYKII